MKEFFYRLFLRPLLATELLVASFFINLLGLASSLYVIQVLNRYIADGVDATLFTLTMGVVIAIIFEFAFRQVRLTFARGICSKPDSLLSDKIFNQLTGIKITTLEQLSPSAKREVMDGLSLLQQAYSPLNVTILLDLPFSFLFVAALFPLSPTIAVVVIVILLLTFIFSLLTQKMLRKPTKELAENSARNSGLIMAAIQGSDTVRAFNAGSFLAVAWKRQQDFSRTLQRRISDQQGFSQSIINTASQVMSVMVIATGAVLAIAGEMDVGLMIGANILAARALSPIVRFTHLESALTKARQANILLSRFVTMPLERSHGSVLKKYSGAVVFKDLAFIHPGSTSILFESMNINLAPGQVLAVTGSNGSGKTTLARMLVGLLEPSRGAILVDGLDLRQLSPQWWRSQIIYMPQEPQFFDGSLRDNMSTINREIGDKSLFKIFEMAGLRKFLSESQAGFESQIVNGGRDLPLGVRRRLALARGLASGGQLAIFDEPTENLDSAGRAAFYGVMKELSKMGRTIIIFSHDASLASGADYTVNLDSKPIPKISGTQMERGSP